MAQDEFTKLFTYMQKEFSVVNSKIDKQNGRFDEVLGAIAELAADVKTYHQELLVLGHKVDRLERWIHQIAQETGVKLTLE